MYLKLFVLIIVILELSQEGCSYKLQTSSKLDNGENLLRSILKRSDFNRIDLKTKCFACKRQNKCKLQERCTVCDEICDKYQQSLLQPDQVPVHTKLQNPANIVGMSRRTPESTIQPETEDRYYTVGAFKEGPIQSLLQRLLNLNIRGETDHMIIMVKPKSQQPHVVNHPVIIDTAHVFSMNDGDTKKLEMEIHKVGNVDENTEDLVVKLDEKLENFVDQKRKANMDPHLMPEEIDDIIKKTIEEEKRPTVTARLTNNDDDVSVMGNHQTNIDTIDQQPGKNVMVDDRSAITPNDHSISITPQSDNHEIVHQEHESVAPQDMSENVASALIVQPPSTYDNAKSTFTIPTLPQGISVNPTPFPIVHPLHLHNANSNPIPPLTPQIVSEMVASAPIIQPPSTYDDEDSTPVVPINVQSISENERFVPQLPFTHVEVESSTTPPLEPTPTIVKINNELPTAVPEESTQKSFNMLSPEGVPESEFKIDNQKPIQNIPNNALPTNTSSNTPVVVPNQQNFDENRNQGLTKDGEVNNQDVDINEPIPIVEFIDETSEPLEENNMEQPQPPQNLEKNGLESITVDKANSVGPNNNVQEVQTPNEVTESIKTVLKTQEQNTRNPTENLSKTVLNTVPAPNSDNVLGNIQANIQESANKLVEDATLSVQQRNDKIRDMVQQIFPESLGNIEDIQLVNNQKFRTNLTPEEQNNLSQKKAESLIGLPPQVQKHPRIEGTTKHLPTRPPYHSKHREADDIRNQPEFVEMTQKDNSPIPFIDRNLLDMNSVMNNAERVPETVLNNVKEGLSLLKPENQVQAENPKGAKNGPENPEDVGCKKKEEIQYLNVDPPTPYNTMYRSSGLHIPTLDELLHPERKSHHRPLNLPPKKVDKLPKVHHANLPVYKAMNENSSEEQDELEVDDNRPVRHPIVESRHQSRNSHHHYRHLGRIIPREHTIQRRDIFEQVKHKNMFFVGDGIKLPLTLKEFTDGSLHLSIDVKELCNCKHCSGIKHHNTSEIVGVAQNIGRREADVPLKIHENADKSSNTVHVISKVLDDIGQNLTQNTIKEEKAALRKRSIWNNKIEKIDETTISTEKFNLLKDMFSFMKNLVSDNLDIH